MRNPKPKEWLASELSQQYIADYKPFNFVDGEGVRNSLYVSGCPFACEGCFNAAAQNFHYGKPFTQEIEEQLITDTAHDYVQGVTFLGGEPFLNTQVCLRVIDRLRKEFGDTKDIWSWSGYTFEELLQDSEDKLEMLSKIDILVDGRFELAQKNLMLQFRGSANQRIIDVKKSLAQGEVVIWEKLHDSEKAFEQIKKSELI
ncbi:MAG: anaerobic ribonucleoside-triphosphate reductase activating protein [Enterococcus viikkiensis]|uniref:Anaerobic ribonucleoside-triphosphate reductase-activating protein n=1 Tax=Enterococcus viikkiensis TaxID=930854 RepID=A0ABU3FNR8_9ENTE|nr:anaerobic ribonucleoside-triphosphate reductase activating protein [Enterococcus viikkiensis]MDT2827308.1 anaerobic ribonucleoside-triphosphate reductase activating protein [Enterococcus viikkiensis]